MTWFNVGLGSGRLDLMICEVFSNPKDSMRKDSMERDITSSTEDSVSKDCILLRAKSHITRQDGG